MRYPSLLLLLLLKAIKSDANALVKLSPRKAKRVIAFSLGSPMVGLAVTSGSMLFDLASSKLLWRELGSESRNATAAGRTVVPGRAMKSEFSSSMKRSGD